MDLETTKCKLTTTKKIYEKKSEYPIDCEFTLPDYCPDIERILKCNVTPRISNLSVLSDSAQVEISSNVCILYVTSDDKLFGYEIGADDYITKPFMTRELLARVARLLSNKKNVINVKDITFDSDKMEVKKNGDIINLTSLELKILYLFMTNIGKVITRESLINYIYNLTGNDVNDNTITVYLKRIREKIGDNIIETKKGIGYIINEK